MARRNEMQQVLDSGKVPAWASQPGTDPNPNTSDSGERARRVGDMSEEFGVDPKYPPRQTEPRSLSALHLEARARPDLSLRAPQLYMSRGYRRNDIATG